MHAPFPLPASCKTASQEDTRCIIGYSKNSLMGDEIGEVLVRLQADFYLDISSML